MRAAVAGKQARGLSGTGAVWLGFFALVTLAWAATLAMVADASGAGFLCGPAGLSGLPDGGARALAVMWLVMTAAMMLPGLAPALAVYLDLPDRVRPAGGAAALVAGFLAVWAVAALAFALVQAVLIGWATLDAGGALTSPLAAAALLVGAGLWQLSAVKTACLHHCLTPELRLVAGLDPSAATSALRIGAQLALACIGCCWAIMALGFAGGVMSLAFMGLATLYMTLEKLPALGRHLRRPAGWAAILAGLTLIFWNGVPLA